MRLEQEIYLGKHVKEGEGGAKNVQTGIREKCEGITNNRRETKQRRKTVENRKKDSD